MATTAPFVKLLRQLSRAKDEYRSGALDMAWDDGKASLFLVFGQPNHATFEGPDGEPLEGQEALTAMVTRLPRQFDISPWRKVVVRTETLKCTLDELMEPFAQLAGAASTTDSPPPPSSAVGGGQVGTGFQADLDFGLEDFPLLPLGQSLWSDAAASVVHLDILVPNLPEALIVLTGPKLRAAAVVSHGQIIDAVWVDDEEQAVGEGAAMALMGAREGTISGYRLESPRMAEALTMLWRSPIAFEGLHTSWIDADGFLEEIEEQRRDCALLITNPGRAVALWTAGSLVGVYTAAQRQPSASIDVVRQLLNQPRGSVTLRQRADTRDLVRLPEESFHAFVEGPARSASGTEEAVAEPAPAPAKAGEDLGVWQAEAPPSNGDTSEPADAQAWKWSAEPTRAPAAEPEARVSDDPAWPAPASEGGNLPWPGWADSPTPAAEPADAQPPAPGFAAAAGAAATSPDPDVTADPDEARYGASISSLDATSSAPSTRSPTDDAAAAADPYLETSRLGLDYNSVKNDLIQIGILWLGEDQVGPVAALIDQTKPSVDDFISTIDSIKVMTLPGHDPSVIRAMAREMHYHAAEYLCGA